MHIAIQGESGSFSHEAALALLPDAVNAVPAQAIIVPCVTAAGVMQTLEEGRADAAVIPVENSLAGSVVDFYDLFFEHDIVIERELALRIRHNLIGLPGASIVQLRRVFSHPVALAQCKRFFAAHPNLEPVDFYDTAGSVQHVVRTKDPSSAAIASKEAAKQYSAGILAEGIEDHEKNFTRFWLIQLVRSERLFAPGAAADKLSLVFLLDNRPGALLEVLAIFAEHRLNMTKIESRPMTGRPWEYMFYADIAIPSSAIADIALDQLRRVCPVVKELGRYRSGSLP